MLRICQMNFGMSRSRKSDHLPPAVVCNCLVIDDGNKIILVDSGLGTREAESLANLVRSYPELADVEVDPDLPACRQLPGAGYDPERVTDIVLTHLDLDHAGGLKDFPGARVHLSFEEYLQKYDLRYLQTQFDHRPDWRPARESMDTWFGLEARPLDISEFVEILLIPLPGHTWGHSGVALKRKNDMGSWIFHVGDAYYERDEMSSSLRAAESMAHISSVDPGERLRSLSRIRQLADRHGRLIQILSSHDPLEKINDVANPVADREMNILLSESPVRDSF